jgi:hypothetical protein
MGGIIDLLALLDGWDYVQVSDTITVQPNVVNEVFAKNVKGWLLFATFEATDAFASITVNMPPEPFPILFAELTELAGLGLTFSIAQSMVLTAYNFPGLPGNSAGYGAAQMDLVFPLPLNKNNVIHASFTLDPGTTQANATVNYAIVFLQILQPDKFAKSFKQVSKGDILDLIK